MKIIVNDTNIFIDMYSIGLMELMCDLPYEIHTVDFVVAEIISEDQRQAFQSLISQNRIHVKSFSSQEVGEIYGEYMEVSSNLSIVDCSVCYYARKHQVPMLTGDRRLRKYAESQSVVVHGILYLFDELVAHEVLATKTAAEKLELLMQINACLPKAEITERIQRWRK